MIPSPQLTDEQAAIIVGWAYHRRERLKAVLLFGSRLIGIRRDKPDRKPIPDIDLALSFDIPDPCERQAFFNAVRAVWTNELTSLVGGIEVELYCCDPVTLPVMLLWEKPYRMLWSDDRWSPLRDLSG